MKKFYLTVLMVLLPSLGIYAQESEETDSMVIEMRDGSKMTIAIDEVKEILFQKGNISVPGNDLLSLPEKLDQITSQIASLNVRNTTLEALVGAMDTKLTEVQTITNTLSDADFITNITTNSEGDYIFTFSKNGPIVIRNGRDGKDGISPLVRIGVNDIWEISNDGGMTWISTGVVAKGKDGQDAPVTMRITSVDYMNGYVTIEIVGGSVIKVPLMQ